jgi:Formate hydrogenlyase subunit 6/NADH:ubiquinone oxidoreductase 23 kD subunit (chain I)
LALDRTACRIIGLDPALVANLEDALGRGVWIGSDEDIEIIGTNPNDIRIDDWKQVPRGSSGERRIPPALRNLFVGRPFFSKRTCIACGACVAICPEKALKLVPDAKGRAKQRIEVDYDNCIRCYCCHEVCPEDAIVVRRTKPLYDGPALSRGHRGQ